MTDEAATPATKRKPPEESRVKKILAPNAAALIKRIGVPDSCAFLGVSDATCHTITRSGWANVAQERAAAYRMAELDAAEGKEPERVFMVLLAVRDEAAAQFVDRIGTVFGYASQTIAVVEGVGPVLLIATTSETAVDVLARARPGFNYTFTDVTHVL